MAQKLHPIAKKLGYTSNDSFYNDYPTQDSFEMKFGGNYTPEQTNDLSGVHSSEYALMKNGGMFWNGKKYVKGDSNTGAQVYATGGFLNLKPAEYALMENGGNVPHFYQSEYALMKEGGKIKIKPENKGKFTAYKERTGKTTEEALHSPDPHVRQMANFARNASHWNKKEYGGLNKFMQDGGRIALPANTNQPDPFSITNTNTLETMNQVYQPVQNANRNTIQIDNSEQPSVTGTYTSPYPSKNGRNYSSFSVPPVGDIVDVGIGVADWAIGQHNAKSVHQYAQNQGLSSNMFHLNQPGTKGDYNVNSGEFRPQDRVPTNAGNYMPSYGQYGGKFQMGGSAVTPEERGQWNQVMGQMHQEPGQYVRNWDHNQDYQNKFLENHGINPSRVSAIQGNMIQRNQNTPGGVTYGSQGMSGADNWTGSKTKDQRYTQYQYQHLDSTGKQYPGAAGFTDRGTEPMTSSETNSWSNSAYTNNWNSNADGVDTNGVKTNYDKYYRPVANTTSTQPAQLPYNNYNGTVGGKNYINGVEDIPTAAYGGQLPGSQFGYNKLDDRWRNSSSNLNATDQTDNYGMKKTLPEATGSMLDGGNIINAEKQEKVLGDFGGNGQQSLMNVDGPAHTEGGKNLSVPDNSFIYSDTKSLKIKDKDILKQFGITNPPKGGMPPAAIATKYDLQKFTAKLNDPKTDEVSRKTAELMVQNYTGKLQNLANVQEQMKQAKGLTPPNQMGNAPIAQMGGTQSSMTSYDHPLDEASVSGGKRTNRSPYIDSLPLKQLPTDNTQQSLSEVQIPDWQSEITDSSTPTNIQAGNTPPVQGLGNTSAPKDDTGSPYNRYGFTTPDKLNILNSTLNAANVHKYVPWQAPINGVIPQTIYEDPTRALAASQENANAAYQGASRSRGNDLAKFLAIQGQAGTQGADIIGKYANENVGIANRANEQAAGITNTLSDLSRKRQDALYQGNVIAAQHFDDSMRAAKNDLVSQYDQAWKNRSDIDTANSMSRFFYKNPQTGLNEFKSGEAEEAYKKYLTQLNNGQGYSEDKEQKASQIYRKLIGMYGDDKDGYLLKEARRQSGLDTHAREQIDPQTGRVIKESVSGIPYGQQKMGGKIDFKKYGGTSGSKINTASLNKFIGTM